MMHSVMNFQAGSGIVYSAIAEPRLSFVDTNKMNVYILQAMSDLQTSYFRSELAFLGIVAFIPLGRAQRRFDGVLLRSIVEPG